MFFIPFQSLELNDCKIMDTDSALVVAQLLFLEAEETSKPIHIYVNSPGGSVTAGLAIYDTVSDLSRMLDCLWLTYIKIDAIRFVTHTYLLRGSSVLYGFAAVSRG